MLHFVFEAAEGIRARANQYDKVFFPQVTKVDDGHFEIGEVNCDIFELQG